MVVYGMYVWMICEFQQGGGEFVCVQFLWKSIGIFVVFLFVLWWDGQCCVLFVLFVGGLEQLQWFFVQCCQLFVQYQYLFVLVMFVVELGEVWWECWVVLVLCELGVVVYQVEVVQVFEQWQLVWFEVVEFVVVVDQFGNLCQVFVVFVGEYYLQVLEGWVYVVVVEIDYVVDFVVVQQVVWMVVVVQVDWLVGYFGEQGVEVFQQVVGD